VFKDKISAADLDAVFARFNDILRKRERYFCVRQIASPISIALAFVGVIIMITASFSTNDTVDMSSMMLKLIFGMTIFICGPLIFGVISRSYMKEAYENMVLDLQREAARLDGVYADLLFSVQGSVFRGAVSVFQIRVPPVVVRTQAFADLTTASQNTTAAVAMSKMAEAMLPHRTNDNASTKMEEGSAGAAQFATAVPTVFPVGPAVATAVPVVSAVPMTARHASAREKEGEERSEGNNVAARLQQLADLRTSGALTEKEYAAAKQKVLGL